MFYLLLWHDIDQSVVTTKARSDPAPSKVTITTIFLTSSRKDIFYLLFCWVIRFQTRGRQPDLLQTSTCGYNSKILGFPELLILLYLQYITNYNEISKWLKFLLECTEESSTKHFMSSWFIHKSTPDCRVGLHAMSSCTLEYILPGCTATARQHLQQASNDWNSTHTSYHKIKIIRRGSVFISLIKLCIL